MKKVLVVALVAALALGIAGVASADGPGSLCGSGGLWTDRAITTVNGTTGSVDIETVRCLRFSPNIQPGEKLCVSWWVYNRGLCPIDVRVELRNVPRYVEARFLPNTNFKMAPGTRKRVALCIRMPLGTPDAAQDRTFSIDVIFKAKQDSHRHESCGLGR